jgi:DNA-binding beta-propeller fold protein YncE
MLKLSLIPLLVLLLSSCASTQKVADDNTVKQRYWPDLPEVPRYEYVMSIYSTLDFVKKSDEQKLKEFLTGVAKPDYVVTRPLDMVATKGMLYLVDSDNPVVHVFDLVRRSYFKFGYRYEGKLVNPVAITADQNGNIYVADRGRNSIIVFDEIGLFKSAFQLSGITTQLAGLAVDQGAEFIYAVDRGGIDSDVHQVVKLNNKGELVKRIGKRGDQPGEFNLPTDIAIDPNDNLYVLDTGNFRVQILDQQGVVLKTWGQAGNALGQFGLPRSITLDDENNVYVSDAQFGNIQVFNSQGELLLPIGRLGQLDLPGQYSLITGITFDNRGNLYVLDQFLKKMEIFRKLSALQQQLIMSRQSEPK